MFVTFRTQRPHGVLEDYYVSINGGSPVRITDEDFTRNLSAGTNVLITTSATSVNQLYADGSIYCVFFEMSVSNPMFGSKLSENYQVAFSIPDISTIYSANISFTGTLLPIAESFTSMSEGIEEFSVMMDGYPYRYNPCNVKFPEWHSSGNGNGFPDQRVVNLSVRLSNIWDTYDPRTLKVKLCSSELGNPVREYIIPIINDVARCNFYFDINYPYILVTIEKYDSRKLAIYTKGLSYLSGELISNHLDDLYDGRTFYVNAAGLPEDSVYSKIVTVYKNDRLTIRYPIPFGSYDPDSFTISIFEENVSSSWLKEPIAVREDTSYIINEQYGRILIEGKKTKPDPDPPEPGEDTMIFIRKSKSIEFANILFDGSLHTLYGTINSYHVPEGTSIEFAEVRANPGFNYPWIMRFYESQDYNPDEITLTQRYLTGLILPQYSVNENTLYAEIAASAEPFTWYGNDTIDSDRIKMNELFTDNFSAEMWNAYREKLKLMASLYGINYDYLPVESGDIFYGMGIPGYPRNDFSDVLDILRLMPNSNMTIGHKGKGATVYASYFQDHPDTDWRHGNSIKKALNDVIHYYNGET